MAKIQGGITALYERLSRDDDQFGDSTKIATVSKKGVVKAKAKGTCYVYAYAQNGARKTIKVVVK